MWAVLAFALGITASFVLLGEVFGTLGDSDPTFTEHYSSPGGRARDIAGSAALIVSGGAFIVFAAAMRRPLCVRRPVAADIFACSGVVSAALLIVSASLLMTTPLSISFGGLFDDNGQFADGNISVLPQAGAVMVLVAAMPAMALAIGAFAAGSASIGRLPRWHVVLSWICAAVLPLGFFFAPLLALPAWAFATSFVLWRSTENTNA